MKNIFEYTDYRLYLADFYQEKKEQNPYYSFRIFSDKAGFKSKSFIQHIIKEKKNISPASITKINKVLQLSDKQLSYFKILVAFNQAKSREIRNHYWNKLCGFNLRNPMRLLIKKHYEYFTKWYHKTIRELICCIDFNEDYDFLGKLCLPAISAREARKSVDLLLKLGLVKKEASRYVLADKFLTTGDEVQSLAVQNFHHENLRLTANAIDAISRQERDISTVVVALSDEGFGKIKKEIQAFRKRLLEIANEDDTFNAVYHINFHLFPTCGKINAVGNQK
jgi:uncharacterized protein (TIGR02147 family)